MYWAINNNRIHKLSVWLPVVVCAIAFFPAAFAEPVSDESKIEIRHDADRRQVVIEIPTDSGELVWSDIVRGIARVKDLDDSALDGLLPSGTINISQLQWRLALIGINRALDPHLQFQTKLDRETADWRLVVTLDEQAVLASQRRFKRMIRESITGGATARREYGIEFDSKWEELPSKNRLVIVVHGLNSSPEKMEFLIKPVRQSNLPLAVFRYPNDQALDDSAELFSRELKELAKQHPQRRVSIVAHSMGGLISRACVENDKLDPGNVDRLIMVAPPTHGSRLAHFAFGIDLYEMLSVDTEPDSGNRFFASVEDGLAEAADDLEPDSPFLKKLNKRERNQQVKYSILLGTRAPWTREKVDQLRVSIAEKGMENRFVKLFGRKLDGYLADMDEVVNGLGDGVVSVQRGRLKGVEDTVVLPFDHMAMQPKSESVKLLQREIVARLK
jgi:pimeloyl-ACP methyl ester carboxylesterase